MVDRESPDNPDGQLIAFRACLQKWLKDYTNLDRSPTDLEENTMMLYVMTVLQATAQDAREATERIIADGKREFCADVLIRIRQQAGKTQDDVPASIIANAFRTEYATLIDSDHALKRPGE